MSTIYVFNDELASLATAADGDLLLIHDVSAGTKKDITLSNAIGNYVEQRANTFTAAQTFSAAVSMNGNVDIGNAVTDTVGFYGTTKVVQPASASQTAITAGATTTQHKTLTIAIRKALVDLGIMKGAA